MIATEGSVVFSEMKYPGIIKSIRNNSTTFSGATGANNQTKAFIKIRATSGKLTLQ
jgi:hypothetical protein